MSGGDGTSIPQVPEQNVNSPKYVLQGCTSNLYVLLIHDERQMVKDILNESMKEKSQSRINNDLKELREILDEKFKPQLKEIPINDHMKKKDFEKELKDVAENIHTCGNVGGFLCVFLGFGGSEYVYLGREEKEGPVQEMDFADVVKYFNGENCKVLAMKPKLFFVQAETTSPPEPASGQFGGGDGEQDCSIRIPIQADLFVYFSSALAGEYWNEVPVLDEDKKNVMSRFVKLLCCELKELKPSIEIQKMVIRINAQIKRARFKDNQQPKRDVDLLPLATSQLTKQLYLADLIKKS